MSAQPSYRLTPALLGAAAAIAVATGYLSVHQPAFAAVLLGLVAVVVGFAYGGITFVLTASIAVLPWIIVFDALLPSLTKTFATAFAAAALFAVSWPQRLSDTARVGMGMFLVPLIIATSVATSGNQFIQASKYTIFPAVAAAVLSRRGRETLRALRKPILWSALAAMCAHLVVIAAGFGASGGFYHVGEKFGFSDPHGRLEVALFGVVVAATGLVAFQRTLPRLLVVGLGAIPALETGARSAPLALAVLLLVVVIQARLNPRVIAVAAGLVVLTFATGASTIVSGRFLKSEQSGEFSSFSTAGSGRGAIWTIALKHWDASGPKGWFLGTDLRSIEKFEQDDLGTNFVGHSDLIEIGVQLGLVCLVGWFLMWFCLFRDGLPAAVLVPVAVFAAVNGAMEYIAALMVALVLAAALAGPRPRELDTG